MPTHKLPVPRFYRPEHASLFAYRPDPAVLPAEATRFRQAHGLLSAGAGRSHVRLLLVDVQRDFCFLEGSLYVGARSGRGALEDNDRPARFIVLEDAMSAVAVPDPMRAGAFLLDFTPQAEEAFGRWRDAGVHIVDTATPFCEWPGFPSA